MAEVGTDTDVTDAVPEVAGWGTARVALNPQAADPRDPDRHPWTADVPPVRRVLRRGRPGRSDVHLGDLPVAGLDKPIGFYMSSSQYQYWKHTHLTVDVVKGRGSGFSVEAPGGVRCIIRSRLFSDDELRDLGDR